MEEQSWSVRCARQNEWISAMQLAWDTFIRFDANDYCQRGIESFREFITDKTLERMFRLGVYQLFVAVENEKIIGIISLRNETHISLLFVDESYHKKGVGKQLISYLCQYVEAEEGYKRVTVNAAPYAVGFYHKLGFQDTGAEESSDGIRFTPMERVLEKKYV